MKQIKRICQNCQYYTMGKCEKYGVKVNPLLTDCGKWEQKKWE